MLYPSCDGVVQEFCQITGQSVPIRGGMEATFKNKNYVFLVVGGSFLLHVNVGNPGNFWKNQGI